MRAKQILEWLQLHKRHVGTAAAGAVLMLVVGLAGINGKTATVPETTPTTTEADGAGGEAVTQAVPTEPLVPALPVLEADQKKILDQIVSYLAEDNLSEAAAQMEHNEQKLQYLFYQTMKGEPYLYQDGELLKELDGTGLVVKKPGSIFYGTVQNGKPQGEGIALQVIQLDVWRYDYSYGVWKDGLMEGEGAVGYHYEQGTDGEENQSVRKEGVFSNDRIHGEFSYSTTNSEGDTSIWKMKAEEGKTLIDDLWIYEEEKQRYYLTSDQDNSHAYVLSAESLEEVRWRNMLVWEE